MANYYFRNSLLINFYSDKFVKQVKANKFLACRVFIIPHTQVNTHVQMCTSMHHAGERIHL